MDKRLLTVVLVALAIACKSSDEATDASTDAGEQPEQDAARDATPGEPDDASNISDGSVDVPPLEDGFVRYETPAVEVGPGESDDWAQWVGGPLDQDYDVVEIRGDQSASGHHALMYATPEAHEPGFTRLWEDADQLTTRLMGGVGGEGGANAVLPEGVVFRIAKGSYLMVQTHYLNTSEETINARTVLDVKLEPVDRSRKVASIVSSTDLAVTLAAGVETTMDVDCEVMKDLQFLQISNHMHDYGVSTFTEVIEASGERRMIKDDPSWSGEWALNPNFTRFTVDDPLLVRAGSTLHTRCIWNNTTTEEVAFPSEMCVFFGFVLNDGDIFCSAGSWLEQEPSDGE